MCGFQESSLAANMHRRQEIERVAWSADRLYGCERDRAVYSKISSADKDKPLR